MIMRRESGKLTIGDLSSKMSRLKVVGENLSEQERDSYINDLYQKSDEDVDFELFLKVNFC
jgi:plastin-1